MTEMIRMASGDFVHPLDYVQRRRWREPFALVHARAPSQEVRSFDFTGAYAPGAVIPGAEDRA
jgi:hypothetical protein